MSNSPPMEDTIWSWLFAWAGADIKNHLIIFSMLTEGGRRNLSVWLSLFWKESDGWPVLWKLHISVSGSGLNYIPQELILGLLHSVSQPALQRYPPVRRGGPNTFSPSIGATRDPGSHSLSVISSWGSQSKSISLVQRLNRIPVVHNWHWNQEYSL